MMEVVSPDAKDRERDYEKKLLDYAEGGIAVCWIVDSERRVVTIHRLEEGRYAVHGEFAPGQSAESALLAGFSVNIADLFAVLRDIPE